MSAPTILPSQATTNAAGPAQNHLPTTLPNNPSTGAQSLDGSAPTSPPGLDHAVTLLQQFIAAGMSEQQVGALTNTVSQIMTVEQQFLANPHHT